MIKYMFKCMSCRTILSIETELPEERIHHAPPCPCGKGLMISLTSNEYAYGNLWD